MYQGGGSFALQKEGSREDASNQSTCLASSSGTHVDRRGGCRSRLRGDAYVVEGARRLRPGGAVTHRSELRRTVRIQPPRTSRSSTLARQLTTCTTSSATRLLAPTPPWRVCSVLLRGLITAPRANRGLETPLETQRPTGYRRSPRPTAVAPLPSRPTKHSATTGRV